MSVRVAILIDGGFLLKRLATVRPDIDKADPQKVDVAIGQLVKTHLKKVARQAGAPSPISVLYRCFYYDAMPYLGKGHLPVTKASIDYSKTPEARFRLGLFDLLRKRPSFALRLGEVRRERSWVLREDAQKALLKGTIQPSALTDAHFTPGFRQKAVDMRLGVDIASLTLKRQANCIILVTGDSDFVPAAKLARREGVQVILDPLWSSVNGDLFEHIDGLRSGFYRPGAPLNAMDESDEP
ncbi:NYN domain-containing protein [Notoacmeibacter marinus]|uniref:NYN domain-containing protein n=1 Tax=Notoacmeibacter marinus TaxID=1876515 RepID=UPI000DF49423|nr:NYN domain-containing protein [Notoacmeibacter marinus]